jgi:hypothetical protein
MDESALTAVFFIKESPQFLNLAGIEGCKDKKAIAYNLKYLWPFEAIPVYLLLPVD